MYTGHRRHRRMVAFLGPVGPSPRSGKARGVRWTQLYVLHVRLELDGLYWHDFLNYMRMLICKTSSIKCYYHRLRVLRLLTSSAIYARQYPTHATLTEKRHRRGGNTSMRRLSMTPGHLASNRFNTVVRRPHDGPFSTHATNSYSQRLNPCSPSSPFVHPL